MFYTIVDSKNQQKMQPRNNHNEKEQENSCSSFEEDEHTIILADPLPKNQSSHPLVYKHPGQPRKCDGVELGSGLSGRLLSCCPSRPSAFGMSKIRRIITFLLTWWVVSLEELTLQTSVDCDMCEQLIASVDAQSPYLPQGSATVGVSKFLAQFTVLHHPNLHAPVTSFQGGMWRDYNGIIGNTFSDGKKQGHNTKNLTCAKNHSKTKIANSCSFTMVAASKLPAYRPAGTRSGQRRPNESFSEQIERITKAKMASRDVPIATSAKAVPKTPPKSTGNVAPTTPPKAVGAKLLPTPPMEPPPWFAPAAPKAQVFIRPAVPRPPPAKKAASPYPPPAAPKDAALPGGYSGPGPKFPARPRPPTPPARPSRAPHVVDVDNIPEIPEAASGSVSSGPAELPRQLLVSRAVRPS